MEKKGINFAHHERKQNRNGKSNRKAYKFEKMECYPWKK